MYILNRPRQGGKTRTMIQIANNTDYQIVCINRAEADRVADEAKNLGCTIITPMTYNDLISGALLGRDVGPLLMDNVDLFLQELGRGRSVRAISLTDGHFLGDARSYKEED